MNMSEKPPKFDNYRVNTRKVIREISVKEVVPNVVFWQLYSESVWRLGIIRNRRKIIEKV